MASWKKIIVSGSTAELNVVSASTGFSGSILEAEQSNITSLGTLTSLAVDNITLDSNTITTTDTNGSLTITPNGTGDINLGGDQIKIGDQNTDAILTTWGTGDLTLSTNEGTNSGTITIQDATNGNIAITPNGSGEVDITKVDIDGGAIDGTTIGASSATTGKFTTLVNSTQAGTQLSGSFTGSFQGDGTNLTGIVTFLSMSADSGTADGVDLKTDTLRFKGDGDIDTVVSNNTMSINLDSDLTGVSSITNASLKIGNGTSDDYIDFSSNDNVYVKINDTNRLQVTSTGTIVDGTLNSTGNLTVGTTATGKYIKAGGYVSGSNISGSGHLGIDGGAAIKGIAYTDGAYDVGLFVENDISASGVKAEFFEITSSILITSESTTFGNDLTDEHIFSGSIELTSSADVVLDSPKVIGGVNTTFSASIVDGITGNFDTVDIDGGAIDGVTLGTNSAVTQLVVDNVNINGTTIGHTSDTDLITLASGKVTFTGETEMPNADINGGAIDGGGSAGGLIIGGADAGGYGQGAAEVYVTGSFTGSFVGDGSNLTGIVTSLALAGDSGTDSVDLKTDTLTIDGDSGTNIITAVTDNKIQISASLASTSAVGVASFSSDNFSVSAGGAVTIKDGGVANAELLKSGISMSADSGTSDIVNLGETLAVVGTSNEIETAVTNNQIQVGLPDNVTIGSDLVVTDTLSVAGGYASTGVSIDGSGNLSVAGNTIVDGNLTVKGTTTTLETQDLKIEDNIIIIGSGSYSNNNSVDSGIVFERGNSSTPNQYAAFFFDETANRFAVVPTSGSGLTDDGLTGATSLHDSPQYVMTVSASSGAPSTAPYEVKNGTEFGNNGDSKTQVGQVRIQESDDSDGVAGDIWIYS